jgi:hypothetical protein
MLRYIQRTPAVQPDSVDRSRTRQSLQPLVGQPVLVYGAHQPPRRAGDALNLTLAGGSQRSAAVQPYDPEGALTPAEMGPPLAVDHINLYPAPYPINYDPRRLGDTLEPAERPPARHHRAVMATGRVEEYPDNENASNIAKRKAGALRVRESPFPIASFFLNENLERIAQLPPDLQLQQIQALRDDLHQLYSNQRMAWDAPVNAVVDALNRADAASEHGDLTATLRSLIIPHYLPPGF